MKDVNQDTGEDLNPTSNNLLLGKDRFVIPLYHLPMYMLYFHMLTKGSTRDVEVEVTL
jgi:hypothetical protein